MAQLPHAHRTRLRVVGAVLGIASLLVGQGVATAGGRAAAAHTAVTRARTITVDGLHRSYLVRVAPGHQRRPLVVVLHGWGMTGYPMEQMSGLDALADDGLADVVYLQGWMSSWNAGTCCGVARDGHVDDIAYARAVVRRVEAHLAIDPNRVTVVGYSNGAMMAYRLACAHAFPIAGLVLLNGTREVGCPNAPSVDVLTVNGSDDPLLPVVGDAWSALLESAVTPLVTSLQPFLHAGACSRHEDLTQEWTTSYDRWSRCRDDTTITRIVVRGATHAFPSTIGPVPLASVVADAVTSRRDATR